MFENAVITKIHQPITIFSEKGRIDSTENRRCYGLSFCISGQITYTQNEKTCVSNSSNVVLLPKNATYKLHCDKEGLFPVINFECDHLDICEITILSVKDSSKFIKDFQELSNCFCHNNRNLKQLEILYRILGNLDSEQSNTPLSSIIAYIETHIADSNITNDFLANKIGVSEVYLRKLFISHLGITPRQHILDLRIKTAKQLLISTNKTITAISEECGFSSVYHFCRAFKKKTQMTPTEYANQNKFYQISKAR